MNTRPRQPDDPGTEPENPYAPVVFVHSFLGRQTAWLGTVMIGEVAPSPGGRFQKAFVLIHLPDVARKVRPASSMAKAREKLVNETRDWIARTQQPSIGVGR